jgi:hypothetical protein
LKYTKNNKIIIVKMKKLLIYYFTASPHLLQRTFIKPKQQSIPIGKQQMPNIIPGVVKSFMNMCSPPAEQDLSWIFLSSIASPIVIVE